MKDQALIDAIATIREMAPDVKDTITKIATLSEKVANLEGNSKTALDLLVGMQRDEQTMRAYEQRARRNERRMWLALLGSLITMIGNFLLPYFHK